MKLRTSGFSDMWAAYWSLGKICNGRIPWWILEKYFLAQVESSPLVRPGRGYSLLFVIPASLLTLSLRDDEVYVSELEKIPSLFHFVIKIIWLRLRSKNIKLWKMFWEILLISWFTFFYALTLHFSMILSSKCCCCTRTEMPAVGGQSEQREICDVCGSPETVFMVGCGDNI